MSNGPIYPLLRRLGRAPPQWHDEELTNDFLAQRAAILATGFVRELASTSHSECQACGPGTMGRVHRLTANGMTILLLNCRQCGPTPIPGDLLRIWQLDLDQFITCLSAAGRVIGLPDAFADRRGWYLGRGNWAGRATMCF